MKPLTYQVDAGDGAVVVVHVRGDLDVHGSAEARDELLDLVRADHELVLDLGAMSFIDSTGLSLLIAMHKRSVAVGGRLVLRRVPDATARMFAVTGLHNLFTVDS